MNIGIETFASGSKRRKLLKAAFLPSFHGLSNRDQIFVVP